MINRKYLVQCQVCGQCSVVLLFLCHAFCSKVGMGKECGFFLKKKIYAIPLELISF